MVEKGGHHDLEWLLGPLMDMCCSASNGEHGARGGMEKPKRVAWDKQGNRTSSSGQARAVRMRGVRTPSPEKAILEKDTHAQFNPAPPSGAKVGAAEHQPQGRQQRTSYDVTELASLPRPPKTSSTSSLKHASSKASKGNMSPHTVVASGSIILDTSASGRRGRFSLDGDPTPSAGSQDPRQVSEGETQRERRDSPMMSGLRGDSPGKCMHLTPRHIEAAPAATSGSTFDRVPSSERSESGGIGISWVRDSTQGVFRVAAMTGPAKESGKVNVGDTLIAVEGMSAVNKTLREIGLVIIGPPETLVELDLIDVAANERFVAPSSPRTPRGSTGGSEDAHTIARVANGFSSQVKKVVLRRRPIKRDPKPLAPR